jgi:hypothetical protein
MRRAGALALSICALLAAGPALADANLVANPGFETGDFTGWTLAGETRPDHSFVSDADTYPGWDEWLPHAGNAFAALGAVGSDLQLSQTFATTPGETYRFRFFLGSDGETPNHFEALWNGETVLSQTDAPETSGHDLIHGPPAAAYVVYSFTRVATGPTTTIQFNSRNDPGWRAFDDVSVTPMPEPSSLASISAGILALAACASHRRRRAK